MDKRDKKVKEKKAETHNGRKYRQRRTQRGCQIEKQGERNREREREREN